MNSRTTKPRRRAREWPARSFSASSATRRPARRPSPAASCACSARTTSRTSASTTTTATTASSARSATSRRCTRTATTWTSWRSISAHLRAGEAFLKPVYQHRRHVRPARSDRAEAVRGRRGAARLLHRGAAPALRRAGLPRTPRGAARQWKVQRDCSRRGYTTDQVLAELDRREPDSDAFIRPQERYADIVVSFLPADAGRPGAPRRRADPALVAPSPGLPLGARRRSRRERRDSHQRDRRRDAPAHPGQARRRAAPRSRR